MKEFMKEKDLQIWIMIVPMKVASRMECSMDLAASLGRIKCHSKETSIAAK